MPALALYLHAGLATTAVAGSPPYVRRRHSHSMGPNANRLTYQRLNATCPA